MMPQDQYPQEEPQNIFNKLKSLLSKKYALAIGMVLIAFILVVPLVIFIASSLNQKTNINPPASNKKAGFEPTAPYIPDQLIVKYRNAYTKDEIIRLKEKLEAIGVISQEKVFESDDELLKNYYLLKFKKGTDIKKVKKELENFKEIENIDINYEVGINSMPNDPLYPQLWGMPKIDAQTAWDISTGSNSIVVGVVDTGVYYNHEDLQSIIKGRNYITGTNDPLDDNGHGTHVAGTIGAVGNNALGLSGVNWSVGIMAIKILASNGSGSDRNIALAIEYAVNNGAKVINVSIGSDGRAPCSSFTQDAINYALSKGVVVVIAAGNKKDNASYYSPSSCIGSITVGASTPSDTRASFSNWGSRVDIAAPGTSILSTLPPGKNLSASCGDSNFGSPNDGFGICSGTSMASPHVAGAAALLLSVNPNLSPQQVRDCLVDNADPIITDKPIGPRLNVFKALNACSGLSPISPSPTLTPTPFGITPTATPVASPGASISPPPDSTTPIESITPTPTPIQTYTCREATPGEKPSRDSIQIGNLICEPD